MAKAKNNKILIGLIVLILLLLGIALVLFLRKKKQDQDGTVATVTDNIQLPISGSVVEEAVRSNNVVVNTPVPVQNIGVVTLPAQNIGIAVPTNPNVVINSKPPTQQVQIGNNVGLVTPANNGNLLNAVLAAK